MALNPHKKNKVDIQSLSADDQRLLRLYGKFPTRSDHIAKHLKDRKYFDSGDYAMSKAGKGDGVDAGAVGSQHPVPEKIPHLSPANGGSAANPKHTHHPSIQGMPASSPVKESSFLNRETSAEGEIIMTQRKKDSDASPAIASVITSQTIVTEAQ
ncbi:mRNA stability protein mug134 [Escovopsis weberi]|uniref:mRNA stability protein n=1 Tax=Escovopsis weberi TaxID=150374 RepID=A0A0M8N9B0_ESCWE|nr:mRNA stability protein mug134 [Escovopsis weberi]